MADTLLSILPGTLPPNACFANEQARLVAFAENMQAVLPGGMAFYNFGASKPSVENQAYPWFRTTDGRWYFFSGQWIAPVNYSVYERRLFYGSLAQLVTYDGGDTGVPSPTSGPMWIVDIDFDGRSPMGPGAIPSANPAKTLAVQEAYGEGAHVQTEAELAEHTHGPDTNLADSILGHAVVSGQWNVGGGGDTINQGVIGTAGDSEPMPIIHPCRGIYVVKWTGRAYFAVP